MLAKVDDIQVFTCLIQHGLSILSSLNIVGLIIVNCESVFECTTSRLHYVLWYAGRITQVCLQKQCIVLGIAINKDYIWILPLEAHCLVQ